jgi:succinate dehydrogenase / fumarate reductase cytochrome b subunit
MRDTLSKDRPKYLNLIQIRLPVTGVVSILHRISGVLMVFAIPFLLYLLQMSLSSAAGYSQARDLMCQPVVVVPGLLLVWSLTHHLFAGIRFLLLDLDVGINLAAARATAWLVFVAEIAVMIAVAGWWL